MKHLVIPFLAMMFVFGGVAFADRPANPGVQGECVQAGISTLMSLDALQAAAQQDVNYAAFDENSGTEFENAIRTDLGDDFSAPLGKIVKLHTTNPELFTWCD